MIWTHSLDDLQTFTTYLNNIHPTIKFTSNHSFTSIPFLDVSVSLCNGTITTDLYTMATNKHQYLLQSSCHPKHTKRAIPFSSALKRRRICSSDDTFTLRTNELKTYLNKRGYNLSFLNQEIGRVNDITRSDALTNRHSRYRPTYTSTSCYHIQSSSSFCIIHYSQTLQHSVFISRMRQRFQSNTSCCLPTDQQP